MTPAEQQALDRARVLIRNTPELKTYLRHLEQQAFAASKEVVAQEETQNIFRAQGKARWLDKELELFATAHGRLDKARGG